MSLQLAHTKPHPIEARLRETILYLDEYSFDIGTFLAGVKKAIVGETSPWELVQPSRGSQRISMQALIEEHSFLGVQIGNHTVPKRDLFVLLQYILINTNLVKNDPRVSFIKFMKVVDNTRAYMGTSSWEEFALWIHSLKEVDGFPSYYQGKRTNLGSKRLSPHIH